MTRNQRVLLAVMGLMIAGAANATSPQRAVLAQGYEQALAHYQQIDADGGWSIVAPGSVIEPGARNTRLVQVRQRLRRTGSAVALDRNASDLYDESLVAAVVRFQKRHGIHADGRIGRQTIEAMNVPAATRVAQLRVNWRKARQLEKQLGSPRYVLVNVAAQELLAIEHGVTKLTSAVIVGHSSRPTPPLRSAIRAVNFHPTWHVPASIVRQDLFPRIASDPGYFSRRQYQILRAKDGAVIEPGQVIAQGLTAPMIKIRQAPNRRNPLGRIRLDMPNRFAIYLHDTPVSQLFGWSERAFSSGCVRVSRIVELAQWLLDSTPWDPTRISQALHAGKSRTARLAIPVPVHLVYLTAWVDSDGATQFRRDIYGSVQAKGLL